MENLVCVGKFGAPHGVRGAIKLKSYTESPENILEYSPLYNKDGSEKFDIKVLSVKQDMLVVKVEGVSDRNEAAALRNRELFAEKDLFPEPEDDEFYFNDLVGMRVVKESGREFGVIVALHNYGGGDVVEISLDNGPKTELFAFTEDNFPLIDMDNDLVVISLPEVEYVNDNDNSN